jgi:hypothetical protein
MTLIELIERLKFSDVVAVLALLVSGASILWNIYRDILLKPRLKVRMQISVILQPGSDKRESFIDITATNHGPGPITCESIFSRKRAFFRWVKPKYMFIIRDYTNPLSAQLPKKLEVGDKITLLFHYEENLFLAYRPTHVGIRDSFGRLHFADKSSLNEAIDLYLKDFPELDWKSKPSNEKTPNNGIQADAAEPRG